MPVVLSVQKEEEKEEEDEEEEDEEDEEDEEEGEEERGRFPIVFEVCFGALERVE